MEFREFMLSPRASSLDRADSRTEAAEILRGLVESIRVRNLDDGIEIDLVGEITNMIKTAQTADLKGKAASEEAASLTNQGKGTGTKGS